MCRFYIFILTVNLQAVLGAGAENNEKSIISVETEDFYAQNVMQPIISLTSGITDSVIGLLIISFV